MTLPTPLLRRVLLVVFAAIVAGCGGGGGDPIGIITETPTAPAPPPSEVPNEVARLTLPVNSDGVVEVPADVPGIGGTKLLIPPGAALQDTISIQVGYEDAPPAPLTDSATGEDPATVSKTLVLKVTEGGTETFNQPVTVTMPYDSTAAGGLPPTILYWDPEDQAYSPVSIVAWDETAGTVTFRTSHFSRFVAVVLRKLKGSLGVDTGFQLGRDSILHQNFGSYQFGGHAAAFASIASYYYGRKKAKPLYEFAQEGDLEQPVDDEITRTALSITYGVLMSKWNTVAQTASSLPDSITGLLMIQAMKATGKPVHMIMRGDTAQEGAHTVLVYAYDAVAGEFKIYDSNFPKNEVTMPWTPGNGFGTYSRAAAYQPEMFKNIGFATDDTYGAPRQFRRILSDWESGKLMDGFSTIDITDEQGIARRLQVNTPVLVRIPYADNQSVAGRFVRPSGSTKPVFLHVLQDGVQKTTTGIPIAADGSFALHFPAKLETRVEMMLVVSESHLDRGAGFSGFGKFSVQPEGKNFFVNFGFESGDMSGWSGATVRGSSRQPHTPTKLTIVTVGFDAIATDIPRVVFGQHALQVNDHDGGYHQSFVAQTATVPSTGNPQLNFKWSAVLEDPSHAPEDQPYVEVSVRNLTKGVDLYRKRFYSNDPNFTGWKTYRGGNWKAIDWQSVVLTGLSQYAGDQVELRIVGTDCALGGHGGYVYLDGEE